MLSLYQGPAEGIIVAYLWDGNQINTCNTSWATGEMSYATEVENPLLSRSYKATGIIQGLEAGTCRLL